MKYKGYELLKAIADGEIKEGSRFIFRASQDVENVYWDGENFKYIDNEGNLMLDYPDIELVNSTFELIEDEIDIDSIEELEEIVEYSIEKNTINQLVQAVKQLNKKVKELENRK